MKHLTFLTLVASSFFSFNASADEAELQLRIEMLEKKISRLEALIDRNSPKEEIVKDETKIIAEAPKEDKNKEASDIKISMRPSPKFETEDKRYKFGINGYLQTDYAHFITDKSTHADGAYIKNARLSANGIIDYDWYYTIENNFAGNKSKLANAYLSYKGFDRIVVSVGQFNEKFGFDNAASSKAITFLEPAFLSVLAPSRRLGISFNNYGDIWTGNLGFNANSEAYNNSNMDNFRTISSRFTYNPLNQENKIIHIGASTIIGEPTTSTATYRISARPEISIAHILVDSGEIKNIKNIKIAGLETMAQFNEFSMQAEYAINHISNKKSINNKHNAGYVQLAWTLTGEPRNYNRIDGNFGSISPSNPFGKDHKGLGAWEVAARYNHLDIGKNIPNPTLRKMNNVSFALNWYPNDYVRFMSNYIVAKSAYKVNGRKNNPNIILFRAQFGF